MLHLTDCFGMFKKNASGIVVSLHSFRESAERFDEGCFLPHSQFFKQSLRFSVVTQRVLVAILAPCQAGGSARCLGANEGRDRVVCAAQEFLKLLAPFGEIASNLPIPGQCASETQTALY